MQVPQVLNFVNPTIGTSSAITGGEYNNFILNYPNGGEASSLVYWDIENIELFEPEKFHVVIDGVDFPYNPSELALAKSHNPNILSISTTPVDAVTNTTNVPLTEFTLMESISTPAPGKYCVYFSLHPQHNRHTSIVYEVYYENILLAKFTNNVD